WAKKAVLIDAESGKVLYGDKMLESHKIASLTKVMTALVLMDLVKDWNERVEISQHAASAGGATVHFLYGEKFYAKDLFKAMLMNSDNTAARALAEHFAGDEKKFVELMNKKADDLKLKNSKFSDAAGLDDENSRSCAYDIAIIGKESLKYPLILEVMQTPSHIEITSCDEFQNKHRVGNTNKLLGEYPGILGAKTGFTYEAGYCLMMMRELPGKGKIIGVVLDAGELGRFTEMQKMLDWAFDHYKWSVFP
ncbi:MAG: D-alanyl-D-alanine carboxypeptidase, partial [Candidatus Moranbacteria bacterium]|nr:D-alanyl-D-alanine carboxypeptidase [Candidatus Moranbacteria bacterium]